MNFILLCLLFSAITQVSAVSLREEYNGFTYVHDGEGTYYNSWLWCASLGGQLPSIHSSADMVFIRQLVGSESQVWLGGRKIGSYWKWNDGSPWDYDTFYSHNCNSDPCCGLSLYLSRNQYYGQHICSSSPSLKRVCRLTGGAYEITALNETLFRRMQNIESSINNIQQPLENVLDDAVTNITHQFENLSVNLRSHAETRESNLTNQVNKLMLDTMRETSLRLRLLETALNVSLQVGNQTLGKTLSDFRQESRLTDQQLQELRNVMSQNFTNFIAEAENRTNSRLTIMDTFLNASSVTLNSSLDHHSDLIHTVLQALKHQVEEDFREKSEAADNQLDQMNHRITMVGMTVLVLPLFFLLVMIYQRRRDTRHCHHMTMGKSEQRLAMDEFPH